MVSSTFVGFCDPKPKWSISRTNCLYYSTRVDLYSHQILFTAYFGSYLCQNILSSNTVYSWIHSMFYFLFIGKHLTSNTGFVSQGNFMHLNSLSIFLNSIAYFDAQCKWVDQQSVFIARLHLQSCAILHMKMSLDVIFLAGLLWIIYPYASGWLHWHWGNHMIAPVPVK